MNNDNESTTDWTTMLNHEPKQHVVIKKNRLKYNNEDDG